MSKKQMWVSPQEEILIREFRRMGISTHSVIDALIFLKNELCVLYYKIDKNNPALKKLETEIANLKEIWKEL